MVGKRFGLVIGNNYPNSERRLQFAVADATEMKEILENKDICDFDQVVCLIDRTSREALIEIEKILKKADNDLVFIYFSGHGQKDFEDKLCLLFNDTEKDLLLSTSLTFEFINKCVKYPSLKSVIVVLDCCYSGVAGIRNVDVMESIKEYSGHGKVIISSTGLTGSFLAKEDEKFGHGVFTYYFIEGLKTGNAYKTGSGYLYIEDLYKYAYRLTKENSDQSPRMEGEIEGETFFIAQDPQIIKKKEYESKKNNFLKKTNGKIPGFILGQSLRSLRNCYENAPSQKDKCINNYIDYLLNEDFLIEDFREAVEFIISDSNSIGLNSNGSNLARLEIPGLNIESYKTFKEYDIPQDFISLSTGMEFVLISPGTFRMGSNNEDGRYYREDPEHDVTIRNPFYLGKYPVTQKQWEDIMGKGNNPSNFWAETRPVEKVSWYDAQEFIEKLNEKERTNEYRLPSEAEWEYACRAGSTTRYSFGDDELHLKDYGWYSGYNTYEEWKKNKEIIFSKESTHPVGQKKPNKWRLYDMHGNIWEWVEDKGHYDYKDAPTDGSAWKSGYNTERVIRGGCCGLEAKSCTSTCRAGEMPNKRLNTIGFRLVRELSSS